MNDETNKSPAMITLAAGCRQAGIAPITALKLSERGEFPPITRVGHRRKISRRVFESWMADKMQKLGEETR